MDSTDVRLNEDTVSGAPRDSRRWRSSLAYSAVVLAILLIAASLEIVSASQDSQTQDEAVHLAAGYSYWKTGDFRLNTEHPPLSKLLAALPLLRLQPELETGTPEWRRADQWAVGKSFLYSNRIPADKLLGSGRTVTILLGLVLGASIAWWVALRAGRIAGLVALVMFAFEPTVMAHSHYVTSDIPVTLFVWLAWIAADSYGKRGGRLALAATGILTGAAFASKFSALFLPLVFLVMWKLEKRRPWRSSLIVGGTAFLVVVFTYGFDTRSVMQDPVLALQVQRQSLNPWLRAAADIPIPGFYFLRGIHLLLRHQTGGHLTYFQGAIGHDGSWLYFPVALLVKSSLGWLAMLALAAGTALVRKIKDTSLLCVLIPVAVYLVFTFFSSINIGIRHLLPIYPFLCAAAAMTLFSAKQSPFVRVAASSLLVVFLAESASAFPNYVAYFNAAAGGPQNGHRFLLDSNLDWGQDLKRLADYSASHDIQPLCLAYFGTASPDYYGLRYQPLQPIRTRDELNATNCMAAASVEYLYGIEEQPLRFLRDITPTDRVGGSIYLYDLRKK